MPDITGAGTQHPTRSHWKLCPGPQSYNIQPVQQQAAKQALQSKQHKQHSSHRNTSNREWAQTVKGGKGEGSRLQAPWDTRVSPSFQPRHRSSLLPRLRPLVHHRCQAFETRQPPTLNRCPSIWYDGSCGAVGCKADLISTRAKRGGRKRIGKRKAHRRGRRETSLAVPSDIARLVGGLRGGATSGATSPNFLFCLRVSLGVSGFL